MSVVRQVLLLQLLQVQERQKSIYSETIVRSCACIYVHAYAHI